jgi:hypothetical protein
MKGVVMTIIGFAIALGLVIGIIMVIVMQTKGTGNTAIGDSKDLGTGINVVRATPP